MRRRASFVLVLTALAVAAALGSLLFLSSGAVAGGHGYGYGPGMMGGAYHSGYGPGMMGGAYHSGYGPGMMGGYYGHGYRSGIRGSATLLIRHQYAHCHTWSLNGGPFKAHQSLMLKRGARLTVINRDVMPHRLVKLAGPAVTMHNGTTMGMMGRYTSRTPGLMNHMGASTTVTFSKKGVYRLRTRTGEDYMPGIETGGADNVLTLTVTVP